MDLPHQKQILKGGKKVATKKSRKSATKKSDKSKGLKSLAYNMGLVERGKKNPKGSQVADAYNAGLNKASNKEKKDLY